jgi:Predicted metal-dependent hydrolase
MPVSQFVKEGVLINLPGKGPNSVVTVKDVAESGVEIRPNTIVMINTGWTDKMWGKPGFWEQMPYLERGVAEYWRTRARRGWRSTCSRRSRSGAA